VKAVVGGSSGGSAAVGVEVEIDGGSTGIGGGFIWGNDGAGNKCEQSGHFIVCPAYWSGTVIIFWQLGQSTFMGDDPHLLSTCGKYVIRSEAIRETSPRSSRAKSPASPWT
jgi:hypothetical protein